MTTIPVRRCSHRYFKRIRIISRKNLAVLRVDLDLDFDIGVIIEIGVLVFGDFGLLGIVHGQLIRGLHLFLGGDRKHAPAEGASVRCRAQRPIHPRLWRRLLGSALKANRGAPVQIVEAFGTGLTDVFGAKCGIAHSGVPWLSGCQPAFATCNFSAQARARLSLPAALPSSEAHPALVTMSVREYEDCSA